MEAECFADRKLADIISMLMGHCACQQDAPDRALEMVQQLPTKDSDPQWALFKGEIYALNERWNDAVKLWINAAKKANGNEGVARRLSDCLLRAAIYYLEKRDWGRLLTCVVTAKTVEPLNPNIADLPSYLEVDLPVACYAGGNYEQAALIWEQQLVKNGPMAELVHKLGICHLSRAEDEHEPIEGRMAAAVSAFRYWCALQYEEQYWQSAYQKRKMIYQTKISKEDYLAFAPVFSIMHCELMLEQIRKAANDNGSEKIERQYQICKDQMALEKHSAALLTELNPMQRKDWPHGGFSFLTTLWGKERLARNISSIATTEVGSVAWKIKGLYQKELQPSFILYLSGGYEACFNSTQNQSDQCLKNLMGLAIIALAENYTKSHNYAGVVLLAEHVDKVPDPSIRNKAEQTVGELAEEGFKRLVHQERKEDARKLAENFVIHLPLPFIKNHLAGLYLKQCEEVDLKRAGSISKLIKLFDRALQHSQQFAVCERYLKKVVLSHLSELQKEKKWDEIHSFLKSLKDRYHQFPFLTSQAHFYLAIRLMDRYGDKDDRVIRQLQKAHDMDISDHEIAQIYSMTLSAKAVTMVNSANPDSMQDVAREAVDLLEKALKIAPSNEQARRNLLDLTQMCLKAGIDLPQDSLINVAKMVKFSR